jgi:hypothetical protein
MTWTCEECGQINAHEWNCPNGPIMIEKLRRRRHGRGQWDDPYARGKAEDAYLDSLIGERWGGEQP